MGGKESSGGETSISRFGNRAEKYDGLRDVVFGLGTLGDEWDEGEVTACGRPRRPDVFRKVWPLSPNPN